MAAGAREAGDRGNQVNTDKWQSEHLVRLLVTKWFFFSLQKAQYINPRAYSPVLINPCLGFNNSNRMLGKSNRFSTKNSLKEKNDYILLSLICKPSGNITFNGTPRTSVSS